jgi:hypothetical protein
MLAHRSKAQNGLKLFTERDGLTKIEDEDGNVLPAGVLDDNSDNDSDRDSNDGLESESNSSDHTTSMDNKNDESENKNEESENANDENANAENNPAITTTITTTKTTTITTTKTKMTSMNKRTKMRSTAPKTMPSMTRRLPQMWKDPGFNKIKADMMNGTPCYTPHFSSTEGSLRVKSSTLHSFSVLG